MSNRGSAKGWEGVSATGAEPPNSSSSSPAIGQIPQEGLLLGLGERPARLFGMRQALAFLLPVALLPSAGISQVLDRFELFSGCKPMQLVVEALPDDAAAIDLTRETLQVAAESRLRAARLYTEDPETADFSYLYVNVNVVGRSHCVSVEYRKSVRDLYGKLAPQPLGTQVSPEHTAVTRASSCRASQQSWTGSLLHTCELMRTPVAPRSLGMSVDSDEGEHIGHGKAWTVRLCGRGTSDSCLATRGLVVATAPHACKDSLFDQSQCAVVAGPYVELTRQQAQQQPFQSPLAHSRGWSGSYETHKSRSTTWRIASCMGRWSGG